MTTQNAREDGREGDVFAYKKPCSRLSDSSARTKNVLILFRSRTKIRMPGTGYYKRDRKKSVWEITWRLKQVVAYEKHPLREVQLRTERGGIPDALGGVTFPALYEFSIKCSSLSGHKISFIFCFHRECFKSGVCPKCERRQRRSQTS